MDRFKTLQIVWLALMGGVVLFATVSYVLLAVAGSEVGGLPPSVLRVAAPACVVVMAAALLVRRKLLEAIPRGIQGQARMARYHAAVLVGLAMIEGAGLFIIALSIASGTSSWIPAGTAITILMMVIARPRRDEMEAAS
jgi:hypothetical protein